MSVPELHPVRMLRLPVQVWAASQEHHDELLREFALMTAGREDRDDEAPPVPVRLLRLVEQLTASFAGSSDEQEARLFAAAARGDEVMDVLEFALPEAAGPACVQLEQLLDEADEYCRAGHHLLTLATPDDIRLFRTWYLAQVREQLAGAPPEPWPDFLARS
jgi:hypothetical protein